MKHYFTTINFEEYFVLHLIAELSEEHCNACMLDSLKSPSCISNDNTRTRAWCKRDENWDAFSKKRRHLRQNNVGGEKRHYRVYSTKIYV